MLQKKGLHIEFLLPLIEITKALIGSLVISCSALGWGALFIRNKTDENLDQSSICLERFVIGCGIQGLLITLISPLIIDLSISLTISIIGIITFFRLRGRENLIRGSQKALNIILEWKLGLLIIIAFILVILLAGIAPTTDADTLAYHLSFPKKWIEAGYLCDIARLEAYAPLNVHMMHANAYIMGGERCVSLMNAIAHLCLVPTLIRIGRYFHSDISWQWLFLTALVLVGAPVLLISLGSGKIEFWLCIWTAFGFLRLLGFLKTQRMNEAILAGVFLGLCVASKYYGLITVLAWLGVGLWALLSSESKLRLKYLKGFFTLGLTAFLVGCFWYIRNYFTRCYFFSFSLCCKHICKRLR